jgi:GLPGLI family protein
MNRFYFSILFFNFCLLALGQDSFQVDYNLKYKLNLVSGRTYSEDFILRSKNGKSIFEGLIKMQRDTITYNFDTGKGGLQELENLSKSYFYAQVSLVDAIYTYQDQIAIKKFEYQEKLKSNWSIVAGEENVLGYRCNKANKSYGGREWTAWFTTEIPIPHGPYKFGGLPGLILKVEDSQKHYVFEATSIKQKEVSTDPYYPYPRKNVTLITRQEFLINRYKVNESRVAWSTGFGVVNAKPIKDPIKRKLWDDFHRDNRNYLELE